MIEEYNSGKSECPDISPDDKPVRVIRRRLKTPSPTPRPSGTPPRSDVFDVLKNTDFWGDRSEYSYGLFIPNVSYEHVNGCTYKELFINMSALCGMELLVMPEGGIVPTMKEKLNEIILNKKEEMKRAYQNWIGMQASELDDVYKKWIDFKASERGEPVKAYSVVTQEYYDYLKNSYEQEIWIDPEEEDSIEFLKNFGYAFHEMESIIQQLEFLCGIEEEIRSRSKFYDRACADLIPVYRHLRYRFTEEEPDSHGRKYLKDPDERSAFREELKIWEAMGIEFDPYAREFMYAEPFVNVIHPLAACDPTFASSAPDLSFSAAVGHSRATLVQAVALVDASDVGGSDVDGNDVDGSDVDANDHPIKKKSKRVPKRQKNR